MDASWVAAVASAASAIIVGVAAVAALMQIRHVRNANDLATYLHLLDRLESANATKAFGSVEPFRERLRNDCALRERMTRPEPVPEFHEIEELLRFLDSLSMLTIIGSVSERLILMKYSDEINVFWDQVADAISLRRQVWPRFAATYEHLAMRAKARLVSGDVDRFYNRLMHDSRYTNPNRGQSS